MVKRRPVIPREGINLTPGGMQFDGESATIRRGRRGKTGWYLICSVREVKHPR